MILDREDWANHFRGAMRDWLEKLNPESLMAELGKLSQCKQAIAPAWLVAAMAIHRICELEKERRSVGELDEWERLYDL